MIVESDESAFSFPNISAMGSTANVSDEKGQHIERSYANSQMERAKRPGNFMTNKKIVDTLLSTGPHKSVLPGNKAYSFLVLEMNSTTAKDIFPGGCGVWDWRSATTVHLNFVSGDGSVLRQCMSKNLYCSKRWLKGKQHTDLCLRNQKMYLRYTDITHSYKIVTLSKRRYV